jgi:hypothetical protein
VIRTKPPSNDYRDGWDRIFASDEAEAQRAKHREMMRAAFNAARSESLPTEHEGDCPFVTGGECRCPMGNL